MQPLDGEARAGRGRRGGSSRAARRRGVTSRVRTLAAVVGLEVEGDRLLVAVAGQEVGRDRVVLRADERRPPAAGVVAGAGRLDLDDAGAEVAQHHPGVRAGEGAGQVDDGDVRPAAAAHGSASQPVDVGATSCRRRGGRSRGRGRRTAPRPVGRPRSSARRASEAADVDDRVVLGRRRRRRRSRARAPSKDTLPQRRSRSTSSYGRSSGSPQPPPPVVRMRMTCAGLDRLGVGQGVDLALVRAAQVDGDLERTRRPCRP